MALTSIVQPLLKRWGEPISAVASLAISTLEVHRSWESPPPRVEAGEPRPVPESLVTLENCGQIRPYVKTYPFPGDAITPYHARLAKARGRTDITFLIDIGIDGFLAHAEAMKLYELAYFGTGDVLELGTYCGLSLSILARALTDSGRPGVIETCDIDPAAPERTRKVLRWLPGNDRVRFNVGDASVFLDRLIRDGRRFGMVFVDHWHGYDATAEACRRLPAVLAPGGFVVFHDYNDPAGKDPNHPDKVCAAVTDTLGGDPRFQFHCVTASSATFRFCPT